MTGIVVTGEAAVSLKSLVMLAFIPGLACHGRFCLDLGAVGWLGTRRFWVAGKWDYVLLWMSQDRGTMLVFRLRLL